MNRTERALLFFCAYAALLVVSEALAAGVLGERGMRGRPAACYVVPDPASTPTDSTPE